MLWSALRVSIVWLGVFSFFFFFRASNQPPNRHWFKLNKRTVHRKNRRVGSGAGRVARSARVLARVSCGYRFDRQLAGPFATPAYHYVGIVVTVLVECAIRGVDRAPVKRPRYVDRQIAFDHGALNGRHLPRVGRFVTEGEGRQLRRDCNREGRTRESHTRKYTFGAAPEWAH